MTEPTTIDPISGTNSENDDEFSGITDSDYEGNESLLSTSGIEVDFIAFDEIEVINI